MSMAEEIKETTAQEPSTTDTDQATEPVSIEQTPQVQPQESQPDEAAAGEPREATAEPQQQQQVHENVAPPAEHPQPEQENVIPTGYVEMAAAAATEAEAETMAAAAVEAAVQTAGAETVAAETPTSPETAAVEPMAVETEAAEPMAVEAPAPEIAAAEATAAMESAAVEPAPAPPPVDTETFGEGIDEPAEFDVLNGRGASVNAHKGNQRFRSLCFQRKPEFEAGNHAAKRRIATEIVGITKGLPGRFLKKRTKQGPWYELTTEKAILKACQVMRDFRRPDRVALREMARANARRRQRTKPPSTPLPDTPIPTGPLEPIIENPFGVHDHDVLSGRGAFVNGHVGNQRFRQLAMDRKNQFEAGNYSEKRALATEIVGIIRSLDPPGRFLKRVNKKEAPPEPQEGVDVPTRGLDGSWEELTDDKAIHKACQVMRDIDRPDRGPEHRRIKKANKGEKAAQEDITTGNAVAPEQAATQEHQTAPEQHEMAQEHEIASEQAATKDSITMLAETTAAEATAVEEAVAAAEAALDTVMDGVQNVPPPVTTAPPAAAVQEETSAETTEAVNTEQVSTEEVTEATANTGEEENPVTQEFEV